MRFAMFRANALFSGLVIASASIARRLKVGTGFTFGAGATLYSLPFSGLGSSTGFPPGMRGSVEFSFLFLSNTLVKFVSPSAFSAMTAVGTWALGNRNERFRYA